MLMNFFTRAVLGTDFYHIIQWFLVYGILGWIVESVYMSICNRKLTNRGFTHGPICPIYGCGALTVYFLLRPFAGNLVLLYIMGCIITKNHLIIKGFSVWRAPLPGAFIQ